jgi:hypothetical protein
VICDPCQLRGDLDRVLTPGIGGALDPLRPAILTAEARTTRLWLRRCGPLLADIHHRRIPLEHSTLDTLPHRRSVEHLRALMITTGVLEADPAGPLRRLEADLPTLLAAATGTDRKIVSLWLRWGVLRRLRQITDGHQLAVAVKDARRKISTVVVFLDALQHSGRDLTTCTQADIDTWFAGPGAARWSLRPFLAWAIRRRHLPRHLALPSSYKGKPTPPVDSEQRWAIARRLVSDDTITAADRVAGALIVLYAQPVTRIAKLRTADVTATSDGGVQLRLGADPLNLPEPFATLISSLPQRHREGTAEQLPTRWLFPGGHANQPISANRLRLRLRTIGIEPRAMRLAAAEQLSRDIPPAMLAGVLGLKAATVARTTNKTSGQWAHYAADRA